MNNHHISYGYPPKGYTIITQHSVGRGIVFMYWHDRLRAIQESRATDLVAIFRVKRK